MKHLLDNLVWMLVVLAVFGAVRLSMVDWKSSGQDRLEPGQAERSAILDQQLEEVRARRPEFFAYRGQQ
jgi:hypothetical protein